MSLHYKIRLLAGSLVLITLALAVWVSHWWLLLTAFVGLNLVQSAFTRWCFAEDLLIRAGMHKEGGGPGEGRS
jgi:hypothetical protein